MSKKRKKAKNNVPENPGFYLTGGWGGIVIPTRFARGPLSLRFATFRTQLANYVCLVFNPMPYTIKIKRPFGRLIFVAGINSVAQFGIPKFDFRKKCPIIYADMKTTSTIFNTTFNAALFSVRAFYCAY